MCSIVISGKNGRYEIELKKGSITASLDPSRPKDSPVFAVRTFAGVTEAIGTLFAVAEYKGQSYTSVKKGTIKKETLPPTQPDFSAYLKRYKTTCSQTGTLENRKEIMVYLGVGHSSFNLRIFPILKLLVLVALFFSLEVINY